MNRVPNPFDPGFYSSDELRCFGFAGVGCNVRVAKNCTIIGPENIVFGHNVRIDANCSIIAATGRIVLGSYIHIGAFCHILGTGGVEMEDFSGLSQGVSIYSASDDFSGGAMTNPTVPREFTRPTIKAVRLGRHAIVGSGSVILPGGDLGEGAAVGALSLVTRRVPDWTIVSGIPARHVKARKRNILALERELATLEMPRSAAA